MGRMFDDLKEGLAEADAFMSEENTDGKVHIPAAIDVKRIRRKLGLTQAAFANAYGLSLDAVKNWETGRRVPDRSAATLLTVIERNPKAVINALRQEGAKKTRKIA
jgi:putative transcriptional regulator